MSRAGTVPKEASLVSVLQDLGKSEPARCTSGAQPLLLANFVCNGRLHALELLEHGSGVLLLLGVLGSIVRNYAFLCRGSWKAAHTPPPLHIFTHNLSSPHSRLVPHTCHSYPLRTLYT